MSIHSPVRTSPPTWKPWLLSVAGIYPLLLVLVALADTVAGSWPAPARLLVIVPVVAAVMSWLVSPWQRRVFAAWLAR